MILHSHILLRKSLRHRVIVFCVVDWIDAIVEGWWWKEANKPKSCGGAHSEGYEVSGIAFKEKTGFVAKHDFMSSLLSVTHGP